MVKALRTIGQVTAVQRHGAELCVESPQSKFTGRANRGRSIEGGRTRWTFHGWHRAIVSLVNLFASTCRACVLLDQCFDLVPVAPFRFSSNCHATRTVRHTSANNRLVSGRARGRLVETEVAY